MVFGIVVEGEYDSAVYPALIRKIRGDVDEVLPRACGGVPNLRQRLVGCLAEFQWMSSPRVAKALVICDSDRHDPQSVEAKLALILDQSGYRQRLSIPVHFYATKCMVETLLLANERAVNIVAQRRGKTRTAHPAPDPLEGTENAKNLFVRMLSKAGLSATPQVYAEVAEAADLNRIAARCPYFGRFIEHVHAC